MGEGGSNIEESGLPTQDSAKSSENTVDQAPTPVVKKVDLKKWPFALSRNADGNVDVPVDEVPITEQVAPKPSLKDMGKFPFSQRNSAGPLDRDARSDNKNGSS